MAESAVALRYAEALYAAAKDAKRTGAVLEDLAGLKAALDAAPGAWSKVLHPRVSASEKKSFLEGSFLSGRDALIQNLIRLLLSRGRIAILPDFFRAYLETHETKEKILRVEVTSASALSAEALESLRSRLAEATKRDVVLESRHDASLLGGLQFVIDSRLYDGSLKNRLDRIARGLRATTIETK